MVINILILIAGIAMILIGANVLVDNASIVARKFGLSEFVIGIAIVGIGTSSPEMVVSFISSIEGNSDIAIGNIAGSNIFNTFLILGITALLAPINFEKSNIKRDIPFGVVASVLLLIMCLDKLILHNDYDQISRIDGAILLALFVLYMWSSFKNGKQSIDRAANQTESVESDKKQVKLFYAIVFIIIGLAALIIGGKMFVFSATSIAKSLGISDAFIAITILAGGTSLPELASCVVAARKHKGQMALGNILGSNVSNILMILGGSALINPLKMGGVTHIDLIVIMLGSIALLLAAFTFKKSQLDRYEGAILVLMYLAYISWLIFNL